MQGIVANTGSLLTKAFLTGMFASALGGAEDDVADRSSDSYALPALRIDLATGSSASMAAASLLAAATAATVLAVSTRTGSLSRAVAAGNGEQGQCTVRRAEECTHGGHVNGNGTKL